MAAMRCPRFQFRLPRLAQNVRQRPTFIVGMLVGTCTWLACFWVDAAGTLSGWQAIPAALFGGLLFWTSDKICTPSFWSALIPRQFRLRSLFILTAVVAATFAGIRLLPPAVAIVWVLVILYVTWLVFLITGHAKKLGPVAKSGRDAQEPGSPPATHRKDSR